MENYLKKVGIARIVVMVLGIVILGLGISLFKFSALGNDPSSAMVMAIGAKIHVAFAPTLLAANCLWFAAEWLWGRRYIGLGTLVNWLGVGYISTFFTGILNRLATAPEQIGQQLFVMAIGLLVLSLAASLYQTADLGIAPYDSLALILRDRFPVKYFWSRICTDCVCVMICLLLGGLAGIGTLVCSLGMGPFIHFFNRHVSEKLICCLERKRA